MSSSDLALISAVIALVAFVVAAMSYRHQVHKDLSDERSDNEKELEQRVASIQEQLVRLGPPPASSRAIDAIAATSNANASLQALVLRADELITKGVQAKWFQLAVVAQAYLMICDMPGADTYTTKTVEKINSSRERLPTMAIVLALRMRGEFHFTRGDDVSRARGRFSEAREVVASRREGQGPYVTAAQLIELCVRQANLELMVGETAEAARLIASAVEEWLPLLAPGPKLAMGNMIDTVVRSQPLATPAALLPQDFQAEYARLLPPGAEQAGSSALGLAPFPGQAPRSG